MKVHTNYKVYPKAIHLFLNENYDLNNINFGNIKNNLDAILQKLDIDKIIESEWEVSPLYFFDKIGVSKNDNKPSDFDEYSNFKFNFKAHDRASNKDFEKAITILETEFINKYQLPLSSKIQEIQQRKKVKKRKKDLLVYSFSFIIISALILTLLFIKSTK